MLKLIWHFPYLFVLLQSVLENRWRSRQARAEDHRQVGLSYFCDKDAIVRRIGVERFEQ
jgi:hypothetical protein